MLIYWRVYEMENSQFMFETTRNFDSHEDSHGNSHLVGGWATYLSEKWWSVSNTWDGYSIPNMMGKSHSKFHCFLVTTNQIIIIFPLLLVYSLIITRYEYH